MRCLAFAQGLEKIGAKSIFVIRDYEPKVAEIIQRYRHTVEPILKSCSFQEDLLLTSALANQHRAKLIVIDLCNVNSLANLDKYSEYIQGLKDTGRFLITIDDVNEMHFPSDIVINHNYGAKNMNYESGKGVKFLLGPAYFIFRKEFVEAAKAKREIKKDAQNILLTMGGSDLLGVTLKVARALTELEKTSNLNLRIVLGMDYTDSRKEELKEVLDDFAGTYELIQESDSMARLMLWSDLAITGGGLTKYETAVTGTPSIIISQVAYLADLVKEFEKGGTTLNLGLSTRINKEDITEAVRRLLRDDALRAKMSKRGRKVVDGKGTERIMSEIPSEVW
jgi:spore coat polysaccharide biosynthesis predicted glycosyltransferase SpsG